MRNTCIFSVLIMQNGSRLRNVRVLKRTISRQFLTEVHNVQVDFLCLYTVYLLSIYPLIIQVQAIINTKTSSGPNPRLLSLRIMVIMSAIIIKTNCHY